ncbi:ANK1 [Symbiodinium sp. CCMP2592]|nr:ANK1 [Symbiodinium sp. CCMP2592]
MDVSHVSLAVTGLAVGWWVSSGQSSKSEPFTCQCHCLGSVSSDRSDSGNSWVWVALVLVLTLLFTNLALVFKITYQNSETGDRELSVSLKGMNAGDVVYVLYHGDPGVYHTRLLAADLGDDEWMIVTPDRHIYAELYAADNPDIRRFFHAPDGRIPGQIPVAQVYSFAPMDARQFGDLLRACRQEAEAEMARRGLAPPAAAPVAVQPAAPPNAAQAPPAVPVPGGPTTWVAMEDVGPHRRGDVLAVDPGPLPAGHIVLGDRALIPVGNLTLTAMKVAADGVAAVHFDDLRVLPVRFDAQGLRRREFNAAVALLRDDTPQGGGLQLQGPASLLNILKMLRDQNFTPTTFHEFWVRSSELGKGDRSVFEHECLSRILESMITVDQMNVPCLQSAELLCRRMQVIREAHRISPSAPDYSAADIFMGWKYRRSGQGVDLGLAAHVASELKNEAAIAKEARKAREEANLRRQNPRKPGKGAEGDGGGKGG